MIRIIYSILFSFCTTVAFAQADMHDYEKQWEGEFSQQSNFSLPVSIKINGKKGSITLGQQPATTFSITASGSFLAALKNDVKFSGNIRSRNSISGFMHSGQWLYHLSLNRDKNGIYKGKWNVLLTPKPLGKFYLSIENAKNQQYEAYAFMQDLRFSGFSCYDFLMEKDLMYFKDARTGMTFRGNLHSGKILLRMSIAGAHLGDVSLQPSVKDWVFGNGFENPAAYHQPRALGDGIRVADCQSMGIDILKLRQLADSIAAGTITNTHSVLISRKNKLVYEKYFGGFDSDVPHDLRSASKSISSALIGIAINKGLLTDTSQKLVTLLPEQYAALMHDDAKKMSISIGSLLTMSSGLDAIDFGIDRVSPASEDRYQPTPDWAKTVLSAPMINYPGTHANYSSANPYLLGKALDNVVSGPLEVFIDQQLFEPLGIKNYLIQKDEKGVPYFGGGMYLTPRDMLKFGLLYANKGIFNNKQVISPNWVEDSFKNYLVLENHPQRNGYGFLWWHHTYQVKGKTVGSIEARGAGGQYIFIIPDYELVVVVTSGNFRNGRVWQPEQIVERYILPAIGQ